MKVKELIEELKKVDPELDVFHSYKNMTSRCDNVWTDIVKVDNNFEYPSCLYDEDTEVCFIGY